MKTINLKKTLGYIFLLLTILLFNNCTTPSRLGRTVQTTNYNYANAKSNSYDNYSDILVSISPLSKKDDYSYLEVVKKKIASLIKNNSSYSYIKSKYPNAKVNVNITLKETKKRTWILDIPFYYPVCGYWPLTPWWGSATLTTAVQFDIYNQDQAKFDFIVSEKYSIIFYPYYRAGNIITKKYQTAWENLNSQLSTFDFASNWTGNKLNLNKGIDDNQKGSYSENNNNSTNDKKKTNQNNSTNQKTVTNAKQSKMDVPILTIDNNDVKFNDNNSNNRIDGIENCYLSFNIKNEGKGYALNLRATIKDKNNVGLSFQPTYTIGKIEPNSKKEISLPLSGTLDLKSGTADFEINFMEQNNYQPDPLTIKIPTHEFDKPEVKVVDFKFLSDKGQIKLGYPIQLKTIIQNLGQGNAEDISVEVIYPENIASINDQSLTISNLNAGESKEIVFEFIANKSYKLSNIPIKINLSERYKRFAENKDVEGKIDAKTSGASISIVSNATDTKKVIKEASLVSDVDKNIPQNTIKYPNRYALIIGNEDYSSRQSGLNTEVNVAYAINDATIFKEYAISTFGIREDNCFLLTNATAGEMSQKIELVSTILSKLAEDGKDGELIFFYAGHGFPDEKDKTPYLIPVDVSATNLQSAIKLTDIYNKFSQTKSKRVTLFLDACFTGGGRDQGLIAARGVKIKPKQELMTGNMVVFTATSEDQSALPYKEKQHGIFTYFLLKKLQESKGEISYGELAKYINSNVSIESLKVNSKSQDPKVNVSADAQNIWSTWEIK